MEGRRERVAFSSSATTRKITRVAARHADRQGYEVDDAKSGEAALEKLRLDKFDLVMLDMNMPAWAASRRASHTKRFRDRRHHADRARQRGRQGRGARRGRRRLRHEAAKAAELLARFARRCDARRRRMARPAV